MKLLCSNLHITVLEIQNKLQSKKYNKIIYNKKIISLKP